MRQGPRKNAVPKRTFRTVLGDVIRKRRIQKDLTQAEAADQSGSNQSLWAKVERGSFGMPVDRLRLIANILDTTASKLLAQAERDFKKGLLR